MTALPVIDALVIAGFAGLDVRALMRCGDSTEIALTEVVARRLIEMRNERETAQLSSLARAIGVEVGRAIVPALDRTLKEIARALAG